MKPREYWRDIPGTGGKYQASRNGEVRHVWPSGKTTELKPYLLLGKKTGGRGTRKSVEMLDADGNVVELYASTRDAARANHLSHEAVRQRCLGMVKKPFALTGYTFRYEDEPHRQRKKAAQ